MYLTFEHELSPLSMDPRGSYFDIDEAGGGGGGGRKRSAEREEKEEEARQFGSFSEKRIRMGLVQDDYFWSSRSPSTSQFIPPNAYASSSSRSSRSLSFSSLSTVGSPQDRYRPTHYVPIDNFFIPQLPSPLLSSPTSTCSLAQSNADATSQDNGFGLSFSTQVDPFGLGGAGVEWWEIYKADVTPVVDTLVIELLEKEESELTGSPLSWSSSLNWFDLTCSPETVSQQAFLDYSYPSTPSDQLAASPIQPQSSYQFPPSSHHHHNLPSPTSHFPTLFRPLPCPVTPHQTPPRNYYQERVAALHPWAAHPTFIGLPVGLNRPGSSTYSFGSNSGEDFASALGRIRRENGPFKLVFPSVRRTPSPPALA